MKVVAPLAEARSAAVRAMPVRVRAASFLVLAAVLGAAPASAAKECEGVPESGLCVEGNVLRWCAEGELLEALCPDGEICLEDHPAYEGEASCVPIAETECEDIPPEGVCTSADNVAWCDRGEVALETCGPGTTCGWDPANAWYDCVPAAAEAMAPRSVGTEPPDGEPEGEPGPDGATEAEGEPSETSTDGGDPGSEAGGEEAGTSEGPAAPEDFDETAAGPTPKVATGGAEPELTGGPSGGCASGGTAGGPGGAGGLAITVLGAVLLAVRRARAGRA